MREFYLRGKFRMPRDFMRAGGLGLKLEMKPRKQRRTDCINMCNYENSQYYIINKYNRSSYLYRTNCQNAYNPITMQFLPSCPYACPLPSNPSPTGSTPHPQSHILLTLATILLILLSLTSSITLFVMGTKFNGLAGIGGINAFILSVAVVVTVLGIIAILCSYWAITVYLHFYEIGCLALGVLFGVIIVGIAMTNPSLPTSSTTSVSKCYTPSNYFQYKMLQLSNSASSLLCSQSCPCPANPQVQSCPTWVSSPYQSIMQQMQQVFQCGGWCAAGNRLFSTYGKATQGCYSAWISWVTHQWTALIGCLGAIVAVFIINVVAVNWRIVNIWKS